MVQVYINQLKNLQTHKLKWCKYTSTNLKTYKLTNSNDVFGRADPAPTINALVNPSPTSQTPLHPLHEHPRTLLFHPLVVCRRSVSRFMLHKIPNIATSYRFPTCLTGVRPALPFRIRETDRLPVLIKYTSRTHTLQYALCFIRT